MNEPTITSQVGTRVFKERSLCSEMFVLVASYRVERKFQKRFCVESRDFYEPRLKEAHGFISLRFCRNVSAPEYVDVVTEWKNKESFWKFVRNNQEGPSFTVPHEVLDRYLYEKI